jgi:hypothetical protein
MRRQRYMVFIQWLWKGSKAQQSNAACLA